MITILKTIEGNLPFSSLSRHRIYDEKGNRKWSDFYNRLYIPIAKFDLIEQDLDEIFNVAISESEDLNYNEQYDYESNVIYVKPKSYDKFIAFCEKEGYFEEIKDFESNEDILDYFDSIIRDNLSDFCEKVEEKPYWIEQIEREQFESFNENSDYCPLCKREIRIREE